MGEEEKKRPRDNSLTARGHATGVNHVEIVRRCGSGDSSFLLLSLFLFAGASVLVTASTWRKYSCDE